MTFTARSRSTNTLQKIARNGQLALTPIYGA